MEGLTGGHRGREAMRAQGWELGRNKEVMLKRMSWILDRMYKFSHSRNTVKGTKI